MTSDALLRTIFYGSSEDMYRMVLGVLLDDDQEEFEQVIKVVKEDGTMPDDFRYGLEGLYSFRDFYGERMDDYTPEQREEIAKYDEEWTMDLIDQLHKHQYDTPDGEVPTLTPL